MEAEWNADPCRGGTDEGACKSYFFALPAGKGQKHKKPIGTSAVQGSVSKCSYLLLEKTLCFLGWGRECAGGAGNSFL